MLDKIKSYFKFTTNEYDEVIQILIDNATALVDAIGTDPILIWNMVLEDMESYLKTGVSNQFTTVNAEASLQHYSQGLQELIKRMCKAKVYPSPTHPIPPEPEPSIDDLVKTIAPTSKSVLFNIHYKRMFTTYSDANKYFHDKFVPVFKACSGAYSNGIHIRSFDWYRNGSAKIVVHTDSTDSTYESYSVCDGVTDLSPKFVSSKIPAAIYKYIPYMVVTGINSKHISVEVNQLPAIDHNPCHGTNTGKPDLCSVMVPKLILDYCEDINDIKELLDKYNIYDPQQGEAKAAYQWVVSSPLGVRIVNIIDNKVVVNNPKVIGYPAVLTNFIPFSTKPHDQGIERYSILSSDLDAIVDTDTALIALEDVQYSNCYNAGTTLYSEFYGVYSDGFDWNRDTDTSLPRCSEILATARQMYLDGDPSTWYTSHAAVMDTYKNTLTLSVEEDYVNTFVYSL